MQDNIAIKVENLSKKYQIGEREKYITLRDKIMELPTQIFGGKKKKKEFWALKNVSFEIRKGEVVGVIGRNGAGKSTLLKILARITEPTEGKVTMKGRIASMLEVGTGFNPELTGRENIYLNGSILGMSHKEIKAKFDEILAFAGVGEFIDTPVKHYSSGMYVRLAFAVAAHLDADILLVDEVLAVGDIEFQKKCLGKMSNLARSGRTVIFVSHNLEIIQNICSSGIYVNHGKIIEHGKISKLITRYMAEDKKEDRLYSVNSPIKIKKILLKSLLENNVLSTKIKLSIKAKVSERYHVSIGIDNESMERIITLSSKHFNEDIFFIKGDNVLICIVNGMSFKQGEYTISLLFESDRNRVFYDKRFVVNQSDNAVYPSKLSPKNDQGVLLANQLWYIEERK